MSKSIKYKLPSPAVYALKKLGNDINSARRRRRITKDNYVKKDRNLYKYAYKK